MESTSEGARNAIEPELDGELRLLREAILMVATGVSPHVTVAGLRFGDRLVPACVTMAREAGVRVMPVLSSGGHIGFSVEREPPPSSQPSTLVAGRPAPAHP